MGTGFLVQRGGSGGGLNFRVLGGTSKPSNFKENDIWVNTDIKITSWIFSTTEPVVTADDYGMVWISTGTSSQVEFNALKKNGIQIYSTSAKQYINGVWEQKEAFLYQNADWVQFSWKKLYLYRNGDQCVSVTGGWTRLSYGNNDGTVTFNSDSMRLSAPSTGSHVLAGLKNFDPSILKSFKTLYIKIESFSGTGGGINIAYDNTISSLDVGSDIIARASAETVGTHDLDVPPNTDGYPVINAYRSTMDISEVWLE